MKNSLSGYDQIEAAKNEDHSQKIAEAERLVEQREANDTGDYEPGEPNKRGCKGYGSSGAEGRIEADSDCTEGDADPQGIKVCNGLSVQGNTPETVEEDPSQAGREGAGPVNEKAETAGEAS